MTDDAFHLTALEARRFDFGNALRGYDRARVDQFREQVAEELERLSRVNQEIDAKARSFHEQLRAFRDRDKALNEALVSAQQLRGEIRQQAEREALLIIREAQAQADAALHHVRDEVRRAEDELQQLWRARRTYLVQLRHHLERQLNELKVAEDEPAPSMPAARDATRDMPRATPSGDMPRATPSGDMRSTPRDVPAAAPAPREAAATPSWLDVVEER